MDKSWTHLIHRKVTPKLIEDLQEGYPEYNFQIMTLFEHKNDNKYVENRVKIFTDAEGYIVRIPSNG